MSLSCYLCGRPVVTVLLPLGEGRSGGTVLLPLGEACCHCPVTFGGGRSGGTVLLPLGEACCHCFVTFGGDIVSLCCCLWLQVFISDKAPDTQEIVSDFLQGYLNSSLTGKALH